VRAVDASSGNQGDALVGGEEFVGGGPGVEDAHDVSAGVAHDAGGCVPQAPAQRLGFGDGEWASEAEQLEPAHEGVGEADDSEPGPVGVDVGEREPVSAGVLQSADVVFDVGVGAHVHVKGDRIAGGVGVVTPVAEQQRGQQGPSGHSARSTRSVSSATAAPGRSSPSWRTAGSHAVSLVAMRLIAA
jgi:hypothetical protein